MNRSWTKNLILVITIFFIFTQTMIILAQETTEYVVQKGDTLWGIAGKTLGKPELWQQIWKANEQTIKDPALIQPGDKLIIPSATAQVVVPSEEKKEEVVTPPVVEEQKEEVAAPPAEEIKPQEVTPPAPETTVEAPAIQEPAKTEVTEIKEEAAPAPEAIPTPESVPVPQAVPAPRVAPVTEAAPAEVKASEEEPQEEAEETVAPEIAKEEKEEPKAAGKESYNIEGVKDTQKVEIVSNILVGNLNNEPPLEKETIPISKFTYDGKIAKPVTKPNEIAKVLLATDDEVVITCGKNKNLEEGMILLIYKKGGLLKERAEIDRKVETSDKNVVNKIAELKVIAVQQNTAIGKITRCLEPVGVGDLVKIK